MPSAYAHYRFGARVARRMQPDLKDIIQTYHKEFVLGLQGPDLLFYYRPFGHNRITRYGVYLHDTSAWPFFVRAGGVIREKGRNSREYAYLLGFICHFILDSECHPFVNAYMDQSGVGHLEIEAEFEKYLLRKDHRHPLAYPVWMLIPRDKRTAKAVSAFYPGLSWKLLYEAAIEFRLIKWLFTAPGTVKRSILNLAFHLSGDYATWNGFMNQKKDNPLCVKSNRELMKRFCQAVFVAEKMVQAYELYLEEGTLSPGFDHNFK